MEMTEKKNSLSEMMETSMDKIRQMVDSNTIVGEPITTPDGVTLIPVSRLTTARTVRPPAQAAARVSVWSLWRFWWSRAA